MKESCSCVAVQLKDTQVFIHAAPDVGHRFPANRKQDDSSNHANRHENRNVFSN